MTEKVYLYGKNPLKEAITAWKSKKNLLIEKLFLTKQAEENAEIMSLMQSNKLTYEIVTYQEIDEILEVDIP